MPAQHLERPLREAIHTLHGLVLVEATAEPVELTKECAPPQQTLRYDDLFVQAETT